MTAMVSAINVRTVRRSAHRWQRKIGRQLHSRSTKLVGAATCAALAFGYLAAAWWIIFDIRIGPVVASLTQSQGVHSGDVLGVVSMALGVAFAIGGAMLLEDGLGRRNVAMAHRRHR